MSDENKALIMRWVEEMDKGNLEIYDELCAPDYVCHMPGSPEPLNRQTHREFARRLLEAIPDFRHSIEDLIAVGDKVVARCINRGTHKGDLMGIPATGKEVEYGTIFIIRIADGRIAEAWGEADLLGLLQRLGVVPPLGGS
jgi:steroid delta-isomerase-like uncharacterized protein